jgi:division protein CdvB (Snf7/Vps24/ESCRT-III family)
MARIDEIDLEFTVWMEFGNTMHKVGTVSASRNEVGDLTRLREAVQDTLAEVSRELDENAVVRLNVPAAQP